MIHELYVGGPATTNQGLSIFPAAPFNPDRDVFHRVKPASHKGDIQFALTRTLDTREHALMHYLRGLADEGTPIEEDDQLGIILMPKNMLYYGVYFEVERPVEGLTVVPTLRGAELAFPEIDCSEVGNGFAVVGATTWVENGAVNLAAARFTNEPDILDLVVSAVDEDTQLGNLRLSVSPLASMLMTGQH